MEIRANQRTWAERLPDFIFADMDAMEETAEKRMKASTSLSLTTHDLTVVPTSNNDVLVQGPNGGRAGLTNMSFTQLSSYAGAPAGYLKDLPAPIVADALNFGLKQNESKDVGLLTLRREDNARILRAITGKRYSRVWDAQVVRWVRELTAGTNWHPPKEFMRGNRANDRANVGLYLSDRGSYIFLVNEDHKIHVPGIESPFYVGLRFWNSEVGAKSYGIEIFLWVWICGNRMVFGKTDLLHVRRNHVGAIDLRAKDDLQKAFDLISEIDMGGQIEHIARAAKTVVAKEDDEALKFLRNNGFTRHESERAVNHAILEERGARTLWQLVQGITASARTLKQVDLRSDLEKRANALLTSKVVIN